MSIVRGKEETDERKEDYFQAICKSSDLMFKIYVLSKLLVYRKDTDFVVV